MTQKDLENAKYAYDYARTEAEKYGQEAFDALKMADIVEGGETKDLFMEKAKRALIAYENWKNSESLARKAMDEFFLGIRNNI